MTKDEARKAAEVMLAYADGSEIQFRGRECDHWKNCVTTRKSLAFNWDRYEYRIKPKYVPYTDRDIFCLTDVRVRGKQTRCTYDIAGIIRHKGSVQVILFLMDSMGRAGLANEMRISPQTLLDNFETMAGQPLGNLVEV